MSKDELQLEKSFAYGHFSAYREWWDDRAAVSRAQPGPVFPLTSSPPSKFMKEIKLSGREMAVLRSIDYAVGSSGDEIRERTLIESDELAGILNGLCDVGYVEMLPIVNVVTAENYADSKFEVNPSYWQQLKEAMRRR